jgi:hypothetical protein
MQAFEFLSTINNGYIRIPDEYINQIPLSVKVIILAGDETGTSKSAIYPDYGIDTSGFKFDREEAHAR